MHDRRRRPGVAAALVTLGASLIVLSGCGDLSREELNRGVESLSALAAQGELIANGVARDATKSTYTRVMAKTLGGEAEHEAEKLADAEPEAAVKTERNAAVQVAGELADLFSHSLGHVFEVSAHWERDGSIVFDELLLGRRALLRRLRGPAQRCRGIPWEAVVEVGPEQIVVRLDGGLSIATRDAPG